MKNLEIFQEIMGIAIFEWLESLINTILFELLMYFN
jgi:hypothetical protein